MVWLECACLFDVKVIGSNPETFRVKSKSPSAKDLTLKFTFINSPFASWWFCDSINIKQFLPLLTFIRDSKMSLDIDANMLLDNAKVPSLAPSTHFFLYRTKNNSERCLIHKAAPVWMSQIIDCCNCFPQHCLSNQLPYIHEVLALLCTMWSWGRVSRKKRFNKLYGIVHQWSRSTSLVGAGLFHRGWKYF